MRKNDIISLEISGMTSEGSGVGRHEGMAVFVAGTAIGEAIRCRIIKVSKKYAIGRIEEIITPSPHRIKPDCPVFKSCGGCVFRHISYDEELKIKRQRVVDAVERIGGFDGELVEEIIGAKSPDGYRNKAQLPVGLDRNGNYITGFYAYRSHRIIDCGGCKLQPEIFTRVVEIFKSWCEIYKPEPYNEESHRGLIRHLYLRYGQSSGELMVTLVLNGSRVNGELELAQLLKDKIEGFKSLIINENREKTNVILGRKCRTVWGKDYITDTLCGLKFNISPLSFFQVNHDQAERLYSLAAEYAGLSGDEILLDLYCGTGTIGLTMANKAKRLIGVEVIPQAVENAEENARLNNIDNAEFICADASKAAEKLNADGVNPDVVVVDPPRKGLNPELIKTIAQLNPDRVVYVSCDCATMARDLKLFGEDNYTLKKLTPVDMFPRTGHVETVCLLSKLHSDQHIEVEVKMDELDLTAAESKATYEEIKEYVLEKYGLKVSSLYISQVKRKCGLEVGQNYNLSKKEDAKVPQCPSEKEAAIMEALKHFQMI